MSIPTILPPPPPPYSPRPQRQFHGYPPAVDSSPDQADSGEASAEATLRRHLGVLRRRWLWSTNCLLLSVAAALGVTLLSTPMYEAQIRLFVAVEQGSDDVGNAYQGGLLSQQRVASYAELVTGPAVAAEVIDRLDLARTPQDVMSQIAADVPPNTVLINVTVVDPDPELARRIADEVATVLSRRIADLEAPIVDDASPIRVRVAEPADVAADPVSPDPVRNLALGVAIGLLISISTAFAREALDTTVSTPEELTTAAAAPSLGLVPHDREARRRPLIVDDEPYTARSEAFRQLRTNLQFVDVDSPPRSILITSARAEEGKSSTACNLAISMANAGLKVCLIEADLRRPGASRYLAVEGGAGLTNLLIGTATIEDVVQPWQSGLFDVLAAGPIPPNPSELLAAGAMRRVLRELENRYDLVLVDSAPVLPVTDSVVLSTATSGAILVVRAGRTGREDVKSAVAQLRKVGSRVYGTVLVDVRRSKTSTDGYGYDGYRP